MIKKIKLHISFMLLMFCAFALATLIYKRDLSLEEWLQIATIYGIIAFMVFLVNMPKKRIIKWMIVTILVLVPFTILFWGGLENWDISSLPVYILWGKITVPFLPDNLHISDNLTFNAVMIYILFFILPILYWYGIYVASKWLVNKLDIYSKSFDKNKASLK